LKENGELKVLKVLQSEEQRLQLADEFRHKPERIDGDTLRRDSRQKWLSAWE
jgi:large subunit ribosomal protein L30